MMRRAFSLIELLLAVFILAIGIISVSALFPAGIAQQQQTTDDQLGPVVAEQALGLLRSRVRPEDFGSFEEFGILSVLSGSTQSSSYAYRPAPGDWSWIRPGVIRTAQADVQRPAAEQPGSIDLFSRVAQRTGGA
ncbi:MAG: prepilin-type N-terminal cleavage/methylation domain-containing protein, partial [Phycisphaerales bacterium]